MDNLLVIGVGRNLNTVYSSWNHEASLAGILFVALVLAAVIGLFSYQRRRLAYGRLMVSKEGERTQAEAQLRSAHLNMRNLAVHLLKSREEERRSVSQEVHDEIGQQLAALKMDLYWLGKHLPDSQGRGQFSPCGFPFPKREAWHDTDPVGRRSRCCAKGAAPDNRGRQRHEGHGGGPGWRGGAEPRPLHDIRRGGSGHFHARPRRRLRVSHQERYITPSVVERLASYIEDDVQGALHEKLSNRELQVLQLVGSGKQPTEIAAELNLSVKTVSTYRARILEKMGMETNAQLIRYALQHGLVD